jgi:hypothetical protein
MRTRNDGRIRLTALVLIVAVLVLRLSYDATNGALSLRAYALVNALIALGVAAIVAIACSSLPPASKPAPHRRLRIIARKPRSRATHTIHLN